MDNLGCHEGVENSCDATEEYRCARRADYVVSGQATKLSKARTES